MQTLETSVSLELFTFHTISGLYIYYFLVFQKASSANLKNAFIHCVEPLYGADLSSVKHDNNVSLTRFFSGKD